MYKNLLNLKYSSRILAEGHFVLRCLSKMRVYTETETMSQGSKFVLPICCISDT